jgi:PAS domain S-box-containing protein
MNTEPTANILVVDDDEKTLVAMEALLSAPGRTIVKAATGEEALRQLLRQDFALILLDVRMPDMDGFEAASLIRQRERMRHIPIIFLSAIDTLEVDVYRGVASGAVDYLFKPVVPQVLQAKVSVFVELFRMNERLKQQAVRKSEERFRLVIESLQDYAVFMMDPEGRVNMWNLGAEQIEGWKQEEVIGQSFELFYTHEDRAAGQPQQALRRAAIDGRSEEEGWRMRMDGSQFWANVIYTAIRDDDGALIGFSAVTRDLTERKRAEEELQVLNAKLEERVVEQTTELVRSIAERETLQQQLLQSQKMESIGTLAGGIAHDFNNILNVILGYASALPLHAGDRRRLSENVEIIKETVQRGTSLVQQLLAIARKTDTVFEKVDINASLKKLESLLNQTFPKTVEVSLSLNPEVSAAMADPNQLNQAMLNLCLNARDAMPEGGKLLLGTETVLGADLRRSFQDAREERYACIRVTDNGIGMDDVIKSRIFEPFFTTKELNQGTGLGLSVVYGIVSNHRGFIDVASEPGRGATFRLYLPLPGSISGQVSGKQPVRTAEPTVFAGRGETILFVEDEIRQLQLMQSFLQGEGYRVLTAQDGDEAVAVHLKHKDAIALVILDLGLPKLNGWEAFQKMKEADPTVKGIFATGYISSQIDSGLAKGEFCALVMKPYQLDEVLAKIAEAIHAPARCGGTAETLRALEP